MMNFLISNRLRADIYAIAPFPTSVSLKHYPFTRGCFPTVIHAGSGSPVAL